MAEERKYIRPIIFYGINKTHNGAIIQTYARTYGVKIGPTIKKSYSGIKRIYADTDAHTYEHTYACSKINLALICSSF